MRTALILAAISAAILIPLAVRRFKKAQATFDTIVDLGTADDLAFDEAEHVKALAPSVEFVPDGFTCLGCRENPALPFKVWCAVCLPLSDRHFRSSPIERGNR